MCTYSDRYIACIRYLLVKSSLDHLTINLITVISNNYKFNN